MRVPVSVLGMAAYSALAMTGAALADGDANKGRSVFKARCAVCHAVEAGAHRMGPSMAGIYGKKAGATGYRRYVGLTDVEFVWNDANLDAFLENPRKFLGRKTTMRMKMKNPRRRRDVIAYLKTLR